MRIICDNIFQMRDIYGNISPNALHTRQRLSYCVVCTTTSLLMLSMYDNIPLNAKYVRQCVVKWKHLGRYIKFTYRSDPRREVRLAINVDNIQYACP